MNRTLVAFGLLLYACAAGAHHSIGMIDIGSPIWVKATVVSYEPRFPHVLIHVERTRDGQVEPLEIEGPNMDRLERMNLARDFIRRGDVIEVCGFPFKKDVIAAHAAMPPGTMKLPALHAQLLVLADGRWQPWGPYGKLDNCVRAQDTPQQWTAFLKSVPMGLEYWCKGLAYRSAPTVAPPSLVDEVNRTLDNVCR